MVTPGAAPVKVETFSHARRDALVITGFKLVTVTLADVHSLPPRPLHGPPIYKNDSVRQR